MQRQKTMLNENLQSILIMQICHTTFYGRFCTFFIYFFFQKKNFHLHAPICTQFFLELVSGAHKESFKLEKMAVKKDITHTAGCFECSVVPVIQGCVLLGKPVVYHWARGCTIQTWPWPWKTGAPDLVLFKPMSVFHNTVTQRPQ